MPITFPNNTKNIIDNIRGAIGRYVEFVTVLEEDCATCQTDPITHQSLDSWCPTCSGVGYVYTYSGAFIEAHVTHAPAEMLQWSTGGQYFEGDCRVQIEYTPANVTILGITDHVVVDGQNYDIRKQMLRGVPAVNRILVDLIEKP